MTQDSAGIGRRGMLTGTVAMGGALTAPAVAQGTELTLWSGYPEMEPFYRRVAERMGGRITVRVQAIPLREHERRLALSLPAGSAADVLEMASGIAYRYVEAGLLARAPAPVSAFVRDAGKFDPLFARSGSHEGVQYGVPNFRGQAELFYNVAMFEAAGLTRPPATMVEFDSYAERLTQRDPAGRPTVTGWSLRLSGGSIGIAEKFWINLHQYGGAVLRQTQPGKWVTGFANEAGRRTLAQYLDAVHVKRTCLVESPADAEAFQRGQTAMFIRESWVIGDTAKKAPDLRYATAPLPVGTMIVPVFFYTPARGPRTEAAWAYAMAANEPDNLSWMLDNIGWLPNRRDVDYSPVTSRTPQMAPFVNLPPNHSMFEQPVTGPVEEVLTRLSARLVRAFGTASLAGNAAGIDAALREAATETESILSREGVLGRA